MGSNYVSRNLLKLYPVEYEGMRFISLAYIFLHAVLLRLIESQKSQGPRKYVLSRDCVSMSGAAFGIDDQSTKTLRIDDLEGGAVIYSHEFEISSVLIPQHHQTNRSFDKYPLGFSCEIVVHAPQENGKIMLLINSFFIPSQDLTCNENYLYVFDSNTARSKAMPEAGGEHGLCQSTYPKEPVFSSKSYICIAFHTSKVNFLPLPHEDGIQSGFKLSVTAVQETETSSCAIGGFFCGIKHGQKDVPAPTKNTVDLPVVPRSRGINPSTSPGLCVSEQVRCDGLVNCPDGRDEAPSLCRLIRDDSVGPDSWLSQFLSLGVTTSISISVGVIVCLTFCFGSLACICCRRCFLLNNSHSGHSGRGDVEGIADGSGDMYDSGFLVSGNQRHAKPLDHSEHILMQRQQHNPSAKLFDSPSPLNIPRRPVNQHSLWRLPSNSGGSMHETQFSPQFHWYAYPTNGVTQANPDTQNNLDPTTIKNADSIGCSSGEYPSPNHGLLRNANSASTRVVGGPPPLFHWDQPLSDHPPAHHQSHTRLPLGLHTNTPVDHGSRDLGTDDQVGDGIVYLGEVSPTHFRAQRHLDRRRHRFGARNNYLLRSLVDVQSSSSLGGRAQSANGETRTLSGSSLSIGASWSSRRSHRRRTNKHMTSPAREKIAFPVEL